MYDDDPPCHEEGVWLVKETTVTICDKHAENCYKNFLLDLRKLTEEQAVAVIEKYRRKSIAYRRRVLGKK